MPNLSILIVVHNEEKQLKDCLETLTLSDELIIILDKCTDNSEKLPDNLQIKFFLVHGILKVIGVNFGISKCKCNWILEIDADERIPTKAKERNSKIVKKSKYDWYDWCE